MLASTGVYNPCTTFTTVWRDPKLYDLQEWKLAFAQFVESMENFLEKTLNTLELKKRIMEAQSFEQLPKLTSG